MCGSISPDRLGEIFAGESVEGFSHRRDDWPGEQLARPFALAQLAQERFQRELVPACGVGKRLVHVGERDPRRRKVLSRTRSPRATAVLGWPPGKLRAPEEGGGVGQHVDRRTPGASRVYSLSGNCASPPGIAQFHLPERRVPAEMAMHQAFACVAGIQPCTYFSPASCSPDS